LFAVAYI